MTKKKKNLLIGRMKATGETISLFFEMEIIGKNTFFKFVSMKQSYNRNLVKKDNNKSSIPLQSNTSTLN